jgi:HSP20 family protein
MAIVKYNPLRELRSMQEQMSRLLDIAWGRDSGEELREGVWQPAVDIFENNEAVIIMAELPGVDQHDIEVKVEDATLMIRGERKPDSSLHRENYHRIERYHGPFQRVFALPPAVDREKIQAACDKGVLTITLPKKEEIKPMQITVEVK